MDVFLALVMIVVVGIGIVAVLAAGFLVFAILFRIIAALTL